MTIEPDTVVILTPNGRDCTKCGCNSWGIAFCANQPCPLGLEPYHKPKPPPSDIAWGTTIILTQGSRMVYTTFTGAGWALLRLDTDRGTCEAGPEYPSFLEAKRAHDAGGVSWTS